MNRYSKILDHTSPSDMRNTHAKKLAAKKIQEDKIIADKQYIQDVMDNIKSDWKKELDENAPANSTTGILGGRVIQSAGDSDLEVVQTGLTGDGGIDYGADGYALSQHTGNSTHTGVGEYTGITAWEPTDNAPDPTGVGTRFRALDAFGILQWTSMDLFMKNLPGYKGGVGGVNLDIGRNYVVAGVGPYGHLMNPEYGKFGNIYGQTVDELGKEHPSSSDHGHGAAVIFTMGNHWAPLKPIDTTEYDTIKLRARVNATYIRNPSDAVQLYYWAGDKPGFQSLATPLLNKDVPHDGWRPLYQKPDGTIDTSVSHIIIPNWQDRPNRLDNDGKLADYSQKIPEWCRGKNTRFIIYSKGNEMNSWAMTSVRFQRRNDITVGTPLDSPEASSFIRVGQGSADTTPEQRKKKIEDMLKASRLYLMKVLGYADFPGMGATLDSVAASPVGFDKIYDTHAATLSPEERREFFKNVTDRTRGIGKWRDKVKDPGSNLYKSRGDEKYFYKTTSKDSRGMTKTAVSRTPESVAAWEKMKKEQQRQAAKGGSKRSGKYENSSYGYENQNLLDLKEKASRLFDKPVKKNKLFGHLDVSDMRKSQTKKLNEKKKEEKFLKDEKEYISSLKFDWRKSFEEGMNTI